MNPTEENVEIRRILLAMDPSYRSMGAIETAVDLASSLGAELAAIFVEDVHLFHLAALPFATEVGTLSCCMRPLRLQDLERQIRGQALEMRKALETAAKNSEVRWSFRVTRGAVASEILMASMDADLVILGKRGWNLSRRLGSTVEVLISQGRGMALLLQHGERLKVPVVAIYNESEKGSKVLQIAATLAKMKKGKLMVLVVARGHESAEELQSRAMEYMKAHEVGGEISVLHNPSIQILAQVVRDMGPVVMPCYSFFCHEDLCRLVNVTENPVLLIR